MHTTNDVAWTRDYLTLLDSISRYAWAIDSLVDRGMLEAIFTPDATAGFTSVGPDNPMQLDEHLTGFEQIHAWLHTGMLGQRDPNPLVRPLHFMTNAIIDIDGDAARLRFMLHARGGIFVAAYWVDAVRTPDGWRWKRLRQESNVQDATPFLDDPLSRRFLDPDAI